MTARSLPMSLPRFSWRSESCLNLVFSSALSGGGGGEGSEALGLATSDTQILVHVFKAVVMDQVLAFLDLSKDLRGLIVGNVALGLMMALWGRRRQLLPGALGHFLALAHILAGRPHRG